MEKNVNAIKSIKFTIIVPAYNVEKYINKCMDSILDQTYKDFEVIIVNDGSTDKTLDICDYYAKKDSRVLVIDKKNGGLSDARNKGLEVASGDYILFVDSDDYIDSHALQHFNEILKGREDVIITKLIQAYDEGNDIEMDKEMHTMIKDNPSKIEAIEWVFNNSENTWPAPKYIVSLKLIKENNLKFKTGFLHEDIDWTTNLFLYAKSFCVLKSPWYFHRMGRIGSITTTSNYKRAIDVMTIVESHIKDERYDTIDIQVKKIIFNRLMKSVYAILSQYKLASKEGKNQIANCLAEKRFILKYAPCFRHKIFTTTVSLIGEKNALNLMCFFR